MICEKTRLFLNDYDDMTDTAMGEKIDKLEKFESTIREHVACEERAFQIINKLIYGSVQGDYLQQCGQLISRDHYNDVILERAITFLCGYPLCENTLEKIPSKRYHISTKTNRVYDISERKNFCSNQCFKASKHFCNQIPESPLWSRERETIPELTLLSHKTIKGIVGDEIVGESPKKLLEAEVLQLEELDKRFSSSCQVSNASTSLARKKCTPSSVVGADCSKSASADEQANAGPVEAAPNETSPVEAGPGENASVNLRVPETTTKRDNCVDLEQGRLKVDHQQPYASVSELCLPTKTCAATNVEGSKMDYLMKLLAQRKNLLSGMVDIQATVSSPSADTLVNQRQQSGGVEQAGSQLVSPPQDVEQAGSQLVSPPQDVEQAGSQLVSPPQESTHVHNSTTHKPILTSTTHKPIHTSTTTKSTLSSNENLGQPTPPSSPIQLISLVIKSWVTQETLSYLKSLSDGDEPRGFSDPKVQLRYADLCRRLDMQQKTFENIFNEPDDDDIKHKAGLKPPPDYQLLKQETDAFQLKVTEFITGRKPTSHLDKPELEDPVFIPPVDAYDQQQIRKKIVLERLDKAIPPLLDPLELSLIDVSTPVRELVHTFRLQNNNIVFKPSEWMIVSLFILKMLAKRLKPIASAFSQDSSTRYFSILLQGVGHTPADVDFMTDVILNTDCATPVS